MKDQSPKDQQTRWREEAAFFDKFVGAVDLSPIDPLTLARYRGRLHRRFSYEFRLRLLGNLTGKNVLDVGCGEGSGAILLAKLGAQVTGIDISPKSIELAGRRAAINQLGSSCRFLCAPLETAGLPPDSFDIIWADAILHHVIPDLENVLSRLTQWAKPEALMVFGEPVNFNQTLRRIRFMVPVETDVSPDERPLEFDEIATLRRYVPDLQMRHFSLLGRLERFVLVNHNYERSPWMRRALFNGLSIFDAVALALPGIRRLAGHAVLWGHPAKNMTSAQAS